MSATVAPTYTYYEIPTISSPQKFSISLAGVSYNMRLIYRAAYAGVTGAVVGAASDTDTNIDTNIIGGWVLDISDSFNNPLVSGIPLVTGIDLLFQYKYLGINGALVVATDGNPSVPPTFANLGTTSHLYFVSIS